MSIQVKRELCAGCGACVTACTAGAIQLVDGAAVIDSTLCTACGLCVDVCPNSAITIFTEAQLCAPSATPPLAAVLPPEADRRRAAPSGYFSNFVRTELVPWLTEKLLTGISRAAATPTRSNPGAGCRCRYRQRGRQHK